MGQLCGLKLLSLSDLVSSSVNGDCEWNGGHERELRDVNCLRLMGRVSIIIIVVDIVVRNGVTLGQPVLLWILSSFPTGFCQPQRTRKANLQRPVAINYDLVRFGGKLYVSTPCNGVNWGLEREEDLSRATHLQWLSAFALRLITHIYQKLCLTPVPLPHTPAQPGKPERTQASCCSVPGCSHVPFCYKSAFLPLSLCVADGLAKLSLNCWWGQQVWSMGSRTYWLWEPHSLTWPPLGVYLQICVLTSKSLSPIF